MRITRGRVLRRAGALLAGAASVPLSGCRSHDARADREVFLLRPGVEQAYGYSHAMRVGDRLVISGAVSMDDAGKPTAVGDLDRQMRNCYADLRMILDHFGCTFDDVVVENIFTTDMAAFLPASAYRAEVYGNGYPTGTWLEVKGLALPEFMIEIELEVDVPQR